MKNIKLFEEFVNEASSSAFKKLVKELKKHGSFQSIVDNKDNSISFDFQYGDIENVLYDCDAQEIKIPDDNYGEWNDEAEPDAYEIADVLTRYLQYEN